MEALANPNSLSVFLTGSRYRILRHLLLQVVVVMITIGVFFDAPDKMNLSLNRFYGWGGYFLFINMLVYVNACILFPRYLKKNKLARYIAAVIAFTIFSIFVMMILQEYFYDIAVTHQEPSGVAVFLSISSSLLAILFFLGGISAILLLKHRMANNLRIGNLRSATSRSELKFLKSQINPHFLFNMLNNANILVDDDPEMASYILTKLDDLLRYQLNDSLQDKVFLSADIDFLTNFLELEKTRRDDFDYRVHRQGDTGRVQVAPLLFIPFVENAVKHSSNSNSYVHVSFELSGNKLIFTCKNPVSPDTVKKEAGGLGLANIRRRLDLLFDNNYYLEQTRTDTEYSVHLELML